MRNVLTKWLCGALVVSASAGARAITPEPSTERFDEIPQRNIFNLKAPAKSGPLIQPPQLPKLILTGITTILGNKRALLKEEVLGAAGKPVEPGKDMILTEGQRDGEVEVLQIDERALTVKVDNSGTVMTLSFEKDGPKLPSTPPPATPLPGAATAGVMTSPPVPAAYVWPNTPTNRPTRRTRGTPAVTAVPQATNPVGASAGIVPPNPPLPGQATQTVADLSQELTPEEQRIVLELQRANAGSGGPTSPAAFSGQYETPAPGGTGPAFVPAPNPRGPQFPPRPIMPQ